MAAPKRTTTCKLTWFHWVLSLAICTFFSRVLFHDCPSLSVFNSHRGKIISSNKENISGWVLTNLSQASQGKLWKPSRTRSFRGSVPLPQGAGPLFTITKDKEKFCTRWAVVTTIFKPSKLMFQLRELPKWCLVVVGDHRTDNTAWTNFIAEAPRTSKYLSIDNQNELSFSLTNHIPLNHFGRKNIGYIYAIKHGASVIWDTDDDNMLKDPSVLVNFESNISTPSATVPLLSSSKHIWNPYPFFHPKISDTNETQKSIWPRGYPLLDLKGSSKDETRSNSSISSSVIGVFQSLADNDPDMDAIYRLTQPLPLRFGSEDLLTLGLPLGCMSPFNAQATLWTRATFWLMFLPISVHGRVSDIWRSYIAQRLMMENGIHLSFTSPLVVQERNAHSYIADLHAEIPLYTQSDELAKWIRNWNTTSDLRYRNLEKLYVDLFEIGILEKNDVAAVAAWLTDLENIGFFS